MSNEKRALGWLFDIGDYTIRLYRDYKNWLFDIGDEILPSYMGIIINQLLFQSSPKNSFMGI